MTRTRSGAHTASRLPLVMVADKRKADLSDSDDDFDPSSEASPALAEKPSKKNGQTQARARGSRRRNLPEEEEECRCSALRRRPDRVRSEPRVDGEVRGHVHDGARPMAQGEPRREARDQGPHGGAVRGRRALGRDPTMSEVPRRAPEGALRVSRRPRRAGRVDVRRNLRQRPQYVRQVLLHRQAGRGGASAMAGSARPRPGSARGGRRRRRRRRRRASARLRLVREAGGGRRDQGNRREARVPAPRGERQRGDRRMPPSD